jgi:hypothetical protein
MRKWLRIPIAGAIAGGSASAQVDAIRATGLKADLTFPSSDSIVRLQNG